MKKIFWTIIFIIIVTFCVTIIPYQTGIEAEHQMVNMNKILPSLLNMKLLSHHYDRGWWESQASSRFEIKSPWIPQITLVHTIHHGLLPLRPAKIETSSPTEDKTDLFKTQTVVQLNGESISKIVVPARRFLLGKESVEWSTWMGEAFIQRNPMTLKADLQIPEIQQTSNIEQRNLRHLHLQTQMQQTHGKELEGNSHIKVEEIEWKSHQIHLKGIDLKVEKILMDTEGSLNAHIHLETHAVQWGKNTYGKGKCDGELSHVNLSALNNIREIWMNDSSENSLETWGKLLPNMLMLTKNAPQLKLTHLSLQTHEGTLQGQGWIKIDNLDMQGFLQVFKLFNTLEAELELSIPKNLLVMALLGKPTTPNEAVRIEQFLSTWLDQGILIKTQEEMYHSHLKLKEGNLQVNGKIVPFAALWQSK